MLSWLRLHSRHAPLSARASAIAIPVPGARLPSPLALDDGVHLAILILIHHRGIELGAHFDGPRSPAPRQSFQPAATALWARHSIRRHLAEEPIVRPVSTDTLASRHAFLACDHPENRRLARRSPDKPTFSPSGGPAKRVREQASDSFLLADVSETNHRGPVLFFFFFFFFWFFFGCFFFRGGVFFFLFFFFFLLL